MGKSIGWLYTYNNDTELAFTNTSLNWCKRWKTKRGATKHFDYYNRRWQFHNKNGYLMIDVLPEVANTSYNVKIERQQIPEDEHIVFSFAITSENMSWLERHRHKNEDGTIENNTELLNRMLTKLRMSEK